MSDLSWAAIKRLARDRAKNCCEYCQTCGKTIGQTMHIEHIDPQGGDMLDNLCLACPACNLHKAKAVAAKDPQTGLMVFLFNPRTQAWSDHFRWIEGGLRLETQTAIGRATIERLKMNSDAIVVARSLWIKAEVHPPELT